MSANKRLDIINLNLKQWTDSCDVAAEAVTCKEAQISPLMSSATQIHTHTHNCSPRINLHCPTGKKETNTQAHNSAGDSQGSVVLSIVVRMATLDRNRPESTQTLTQIQVKLKQKRRRRSKNETKLMHSVIELFGQ